MTIASPGNIIQHFRIKGSFQKIIPVTKGHIHQTYHLINHAPGYPDYLLQKINHSIFKDVPLLMDNLKIITHHVTQRLKDLYPSHLPRTSLTLIPSNDGGSYYQKKDQEYWRVFIFIKDHQVIEQVENPDQVYQGAKMYGEFLRLLSDLKVDQIKTTIPHFHDLEMRLKLFFNAVERDPLGRVKEVSKEIKHIQTSAHNMGTVQRLGKAGKIPLRITHNDTKFNNVLLDDKGKGLCVIHLDTTMPGYLQFDFGDGVPSSVQNLPEDLRDLSQMDLNLENFEAFTQGYLEQTVDLLTPADWDCLSLSPAFMAFMMGVRFLTDYIVGDEYYKIKYHDHNLVRARTQLKLAKILNERPSDLECIINKFRFSMN